MPQLPSQIPENLSRALSIAPFTGAGAPWDLGINGLGFMLSTLDQEYPFEFRSYEIQSIPNQRPRIDDSDEPGEQTLSPWWARAQHSWHEGAGQEVFDSGVSSRYKFQSSKGMNPWVDGKLSMHKEVIAHRTDSVDDHHLLTSSTALFYTANGVLFRDPDPYTGSEGNEDNLSDFFGLPINSITSDGTHIYASIDTQGIQRTVIDGIMAWNQINVQLDVEVLSFVKGRLLGAKGPSLFEYDLSDTDEPEAFHVDAAPTWRWTAITEAGPAIYFSGFAGDRSEIYAARLTAQDIPYLSAATLGAMRSVWTAPEGETVHTIRGYVGQQILIGTSRGVRIATVIPGEGEISVSGLIAETEFPVRCFEAQGEFAWFGWEKFDTSMGSTGLGRIHLGDLTHASDLMYDGSVGEIREVVQYRGRMFMVVGEGANSTIAKEHATNLRTNSYIDIGDIRFGTTERKTLRYFDILLEGSGKWSLYMSVNGNSLAPFTTDNLSPGYYEEVITLEGTRFSTRIELSRDELDASLGPSILEWRLRSEARITGRFSYIVPVMVYDFLVNQNDIEVGYEGMALDMLNHLKALYTNDSDLQFNPLESGIPGASGPVMVKVEDLRFKTFTPPKGGRGFGGIALVIMRDVR